jgi:hypothetical protein
VGNATPIGSTLYKSCLRLRPQVVVYFAFLVDGGRPRPCCLGLAECDSTQVFDLPSCHSYQRTSKKESRIWSHGCGSFAPGLQGYELFRVLYNIRGRSMRTLWCETTTLGHCGGDAESIKRLLSPQVWNVYPSLPSQPLTSVSKICP